MENILLTKNEEYLIASARYFGIIIFKINENDFTEIAHYEIKYCEQTILSNDEKIAYISNGSNGILVLNIEDFSNI